MEIQIPGNTLPALVPTSEVPRDCCRNPTVILEARFINLRGHFKTPLEYETSFETSEKKKKTTNPQFVIVHKV